MQIIQLEARIAAPPERCFLLSLSIDLHQRSTSDTGERAIAGVTHGRIGPDQTVTWRGRHFGLWLTHKSRITGYSEPFWFQDSMEEGAFQTFVHDHYFSAEGHGTLMRDELRFSAPLGPLGVVAERLVLRRYMTGFLQKRNEVIRQIAEGPKSEWSHFTR